MTFSMQTCAYDALGPNSPFIRSNCRACALRKFAGGDLYWSSRALGMLTPAYTNALRQAFEGEDVMKVDAEIDGVVERIYKQRAEML